MIGIYKITNKINGKVYIGQSVHIERRWQEHKKRSFQQGYTSYNTPLSRAFRKYGIDNFSFEIIEECKKDALDDREKYWIKQYHSYEQDKGYNLTLGGDHHFKITLSPNEISEIILLLKTSLLSQQEIANKFNINQSMISRINNGFYWHQENEQYPLRESIQKLKAEQDKLQKEKNKIERKQNKSIKNKIDRETLKNLIRTTPFTTIGKMYNVSDNAIRKWCKTYELPSTKKEINSYSNQEWENI